MNSTKRRCLKSVQHQQQTNIEIVTSEVGHLGRGSRFVVVDVGGGCRHLGNESIESGKDMKHHETV